MSYAIEAYQPGVPRILKFQDIKLSVTERPGNKNYVVLAIFQVSTETCNVDRMQIAAPFIVLILSKSGVHNN